MEIDTDKTYTGKIIYWNLMYGFLETPELEKNIFFHCKNIPEIVAQKIHLLDIVRFKVRISNSTGKSSASSIKYKQKANLNEYQRKIGIIYDWNGRFGFIKYPTEGKKIFLFHTRLLHSKNIKNGQLIVFNPVISNKDKSHLFAYFAYPITHEKNLDFLQEQYSNFEIPELKEYINKIAQNNTQLTIPEKFELALLNLGTISTTQQYLKLITLLQNYKTEFDYIPDYSLLSKFLSDTYLIQLWETNQIDSYNLETIKTYFITASADTKRLIAVKISIQDRETILFAYFDFLQKNRKIERLNNDVKTLLSIVYRNEETRLPTLFEKIKAKLISVLQPIEIIDLWLHDFIDDLPQSYIVSHFDIDNSHLVKLLIQKKNENGQSKYKELIYKIYEQYFLTVSKKENFDFDEEFVRLIKRLQIFEKEYPEYFLYIINSIRIILKSYQKFVLWIFGINIDFDALTYLQNNQNEINHYFKIKFFLRFSQENKQISITKLLQEIPIDQSKLVDFVINYAWNDLVYPTKKLEIEDEISFLTDVVEFNKICSQNIDIYYLANEIYNSVPLYNEIHLRLWLYDFTANYEYVGFRDYFKKLTYKEQEIFKQKGNKTNWEQTTEQEIIEVVPCSKYQLNADNTITYFAVLENIYFGSGFIKLRKEDSKYTDLFLVPYSSIGLNGIPCSHVFNTIPLTIIVNFNTIENVQGLDELFSSIHTAEIVKALGIVINPTGGSQKQNKSYVEDIVLRKEVISFLNENQVANIITTTVYEPKNSYRRLDTLSGIDTYEKIQLFTIETTDGYAIVWENIDFSDDRATYVFKSSVENHSLQLQKIVHAIASFSQFRSTLSSTKEEEKLLIFKHDFGFILSIRKQRGQNEAFSNWLSKLEKAFLQPIPALPTPDELQEIENWSPETPHTARVNKSYHTPTSNPHNSKKQEYTYKKSAVIKEDELATTDFYEKQTFTPPNDKQSTTENNNNNTSNNTTNKKETKNRKSLLESLQSFNTYFADFLTTQPQPTETHLPEEDTYQQYYYETDDDYKRDAFYAITGEQYGDYDDCREAGGDFDSLKDATGH